MNFKYEICLLLAAIGLFAISAFLYSYPTYQEGFALASSFEYQGYAFSFVGFGSLLMVAASISFMRRSKTTDGQISSYRV
jgi:hypothetical protein